MADVREQQRYFHEVVVPAVMRRNYGRKAMEGVELPQYKCHKLVRAAKITDISPVDANGDVKLVLGEIGGSVGVGEDWLVGRKAEVGGYYVVYEDGYTSFSPAKAFEDGYTLVE